MLGGVRWSQGALLQGFPGELGRGGFAACMCWRDKGVCCMDILGRPEGGLCCMDVRRFCQVGVRGSWGEVCRTIIQGI